MNWFIKNLWESCSDNTPEIERFIAQEHPDRFFDLAGAEKNLNQVLKKQRLAKFVSAQTLKDWIYRCTGELDNYTNLNMLCGLLNPNRKDYEQAFEQVVEAYNHFYNFCPQQKLGNQSPEELKAKRQKKGEPSDWRFSFQRIAPLDWGKNHWQGICLMKKFKFKKALKKFNKLFQFLLGHQTSYGEVYRHYANKGLCHIFLGEKRTGFYFLKLAKQLNPCYDFAREQIWRYKKGEWREIAQQKREKPLKNDPGYKYYQFLKKFKINFAHAPETPSKITGLYRPDKKRKNKKRTKK